MASNLCAIYYGDSKARLIAVSFTAPRFRGRAALLSAAEGGDEDALRALELDARARTFACLRGELPEWIAKIVAADALKAARERRDARRRAWHKYPAWRDVLADRKPGNVPERAIRAVFEQAFWRAQFRTATNAHKQTVTLVARGEEWATSTVEMINSADAGMSKAYCSVQWEVRASAHTWKVSANIFGVPKAQRGSPGLLYLSPTVRVRQGRGTALVCERLAATESGRLVWQ